VRLFGIEKDVAIGPPDNAARYWKLDRDQMTWERERTNQVAGATTHDRIMIRTKPLITVNDLTSRLAVVRPYVFNSHPVPEDFEGLWLEVGDDPIKTVGDRLWKTGAKVVEETFDPTITETTELAPDYAGPVNRHNALWFRPEPLVLSGVVVRVTSRD
jgi:hypothetical protein